MRGMVFMLPSLKSFFFSTIILNYVIQKPLDILKYLPLQ